MVRTVTKLQDKRVREKQPSPNSTAEGSYCEQLMVLQENSLLRFGSF